MRSSARPRNSCRLRAGRTSFSEDEADVVEDYAPDEHVCPHCRCELLDVGVRDRSYVEIEPIKPKKRLVHIHRCMCPECMEAFEAIAANPEADVTDILFPKKPDAEVGQPAAKP